MSANIIAEDCSIKLMMKVIRFYKVIGHQTDGTEIGEKDAYGILKRGKRHRKKTTKGPTTSCSNGRMEVAHGILKRMLEIHIQYN